MNIQCIRWRSRRGMLELDILLEQFWSRFGEGLSGHDVDALAQLLGLEDVDLLEIILKKHEHPDPRVRNVLRMLRQ